MSRFGMGFGKDNPKDIQGFRPAVRISSAKVQQMKNKWFTDHKEPSVRPDWFQTKHKPEQRVGGPDLGEWKVVWHPRSRMDSPTVRIIPPYSRHHRTGSGRHAHRGGQMGTA
jgi:hypothetical protein